MKTAQVDNSNLGIDNTKNVQQQVPLAGIEKGTSGQDEKPSLPHVAHTFA